MFHKLTFYLLSRYSIAVKLVCHVNKKFIAFHSGCPGSYHDSSVFQRMRISQTPDSYFDESQYLLADSAYAAIRN
ncbi:transposase family protein [Xanthomonas hawaiiensis]|uniref:transposase family protein n=1 Tax=Xanthomonas hawaiiensis TaxID=3003247 RepID=UPI003CCD49E4